MSGTIQHDGKPVGQDADSGGFLDQVGGAARGRCVRTGRASAEYRPGVLPSLIESHHTTVVNCGPALGQFTLMSQVEPVGKLGNQSLDGTRACT
jgi:hypothetical protein